MVTSAPATTTTTTPTKIGAREICPRCKKPLFTNYYEPECLQCGYAHYEFTPPTQIGGKSQMSSGRKYIFRYVGDFPKMAERLVHSRLERLRNRVVRVPTCPFCEAEMEQSSLSGKRREIREERYRCPDGHRISLIPLKDQNMYMGWK